MNLLIAFGSNIRGDCDFLSDRDMLILGDDEREISSKEKEARGGGYSVTRFTMRGACFMASRGNLFLKHVFDEGVLVSGSQSAYEKLAQKWKEANSYDKEIEETLDISEVLMHVPFSEKTFPVIVDITITSLRNILIRILATKGFFVFSWNDIIAQSIKVGILNERSRALLLLCRNIKNAHRRGLMINISLNFLNELESFVAFIYKRKHLFGFNTCRSGGCIYEKYEYGSYKQLRSLELLEASYHRGALGRSVRQWIENPNSFTSSANKARSGLIY